MEKLLLVDGNSIMNRAFYGTQDSFMKNSEGLYTGAVYGFLNILDKYRKAEQPTHIAVAFDLRAPTFRHKKYEGYKGTRKGMPEELAMQMPVIKEVLDAMKIRRLELETYEADDIIGTYAVRAEAAGMQCRILTGDRDAFQLITEQIHVLLPTTRQGAAAAEHYDPAAIREKYGVSPERMLQVKALMGDASDNIPGVPGVGEKTALSLVTEYGDLENLYNHLQEIKKPALRTKLETYKEQAFLSRELAEICKSVPLETPVSDFAVAEPDGPLLLSLLKRLEFDSLIKKYGLTEAAPAAELPAEVLPVRTVNFAFEMAQLPDFTAGKTLYIDCVWDGARLSKIDLLTEGGSEIWSVFFLTAEMEDLFTEALRSAFVSERVPKCMYNAKPLILWLMRHNCGLAGLCWDFSVAAYICDGARKFEGLPDVFRFFTGSEMKTEPVAALRYLAEPAEKRLQKDGLIHLYRDVELPLVTVLADLERIGFRVDPKVLREEGALLDKRIAELTEQIYGYAGRPFNINSPKQLGEILFDELGLESKKKTKTGNKTTNQEVLEELSDKHPIISLIMEFRQNTKLKSTYIDGLLNAIDPVTGRVHSSFHQTVTATGRLSSTEPNLQNIPVRHELGRRIRKAFIPADENHVLIDADYSQIELRVMAHMSGDTAMQEAFRQDLDIHTITAAQINRIPVDLVTPKMRSNAKAVNFGIIYGISEFGLARDTGISRFEAKKYIAEYFERYPGVKAFLDGLVESAKKTGFAATLLGRRRYLPELSSAKYVTRSFGERVAMNMPIQGTAADIIKIAMIRVYERLQREGYRARLILQVHDELLIDAPKEEAAAVMALLKDCMEHAFPMEVPLRVSVACGENWYEAK